MIYTWIHDLISELIIDYNLIPIEFQPYIIFIELLLVLFFIKAIFFPVIFLWKNTTAMIYNKRRR